MYLYYIYILVYIVYTNSKFKKNLKHPCGESIVLPTQ